MSIIFCNSGCCKLHVIKYTTRKLLTQQIASDSFQVKKSPKRRKAGVFVYDPTSDRILLVQSCGRFWGPPKGSVEDDETFEQCARRELKEETGINLEQNESFLKGCFLKNNAFYFYYERPFVDVSVQCSNDKHNDANGVGWFKSSCLKEMISTEKISINQHCRLGLKKFFDFNI